MTQPKKKKKKKLDFREYTVYKVSELIFNI